MVRPHTKKKICLGLPSVWASHRTTHSTYIKQTNTNNELPSLVVLELNKTLCSQIFLPQALSHAFLALSSHPPPMQRDKAPVLRAGEGMAATWFQSSGSSLRRGQICLRLIARP